MSNGFITRKLYDIDDNYRYIKEIITKNTIWEVPNNIKDNKLYITTVGGGGAGIALQHNGMYAYVDYAGSQPIVSRRYQNLKTFMGGRGANVNYVELNTSQLKNITTININIGKGGTPYRTFAVNNNIKSFSKGSDGTDTLFGNYSIARGGSSYGSDNNNGMTGSGGNSNIRLYDVKNSKYYYKTEQGGEKKYLYESFLRSSGSILGYNYSIQAEFEVTGYGGGASYGPGGDAGKNGINGSGGGGGSITGCYGGDGLCIIEYYIKN